MKKLQELKEQIQQSSDRYGTTNALTIDAWRDYAEALEAKGHYDEAIEAWENVLELMEQRGRGYENMCTFTARGSLAMLLTDKDPQRSMDILSEIAVQLEEYKLVHVAKYVRDLVVAIGAGTANRRDYL